MGMVEEAYGVQNRTSGRIDLVTINRYRSWEAEFPQEKKESQY
jgi:hypothetical protein